MAAIESLEQKKVQVSHGLLFGWQIMEHILNLCTLDFFIDCFYSETLCFRFN